MIFFGEGMLLNAVTKYLDHYHCYRNRQGIGNLRITPPPDEPTEGKIVCQEELGGILKYYHSRNGIELQAYYAMIVCLRMQIWTGRKPTKRNFEMLNYYFTGLASEEELLTHLEKLKRQDEAKVQPSR